MVAYTLSFDVKRTYYRIKPRPRWRIFGRDQLESYQQWERQVYHGLTHDQAQVVIEASERGWVTSMGHLLMRLMTRDGPVKNIVLRMEPGERKSGYYIASDGEGVRAGVST